MRPNDCGIDGMAPCLLAAQTRQGFECRVPHAELAPACEAHKDRVPIAVVCRPMNLSICQNRLSTICDTRNRLEVDLGGCSFTAKVQGDQTPAGKSARRRFRESIGDVNDIPTCEARTTAKDYPSNSAGASTPWRRSPGRQAEAGYRFVLGV
jgi:hypothetical protein